MARLGRSLPNTQRQFPQVEWWAAAGRVQGVAVAVAVQAGGTLGPTLTGVKAGDTLILTVVNATVVTGQAASAVSGGATWALATTTVGTIGAIDIWIGT